MSLPKAVPAESFPIAVVSPRLNQDFHEWDEVHPWHVRNRMMRYHARDADRIRTEAASDARLHEPSSDTMEPRQYSRPTNGNPLSPLEKRELLREYFLHYESIAQKNPSFPNDSQINTAGPCGKFAAWRSRCRPGRRALCSAQPVGLGAMPFAHADLFLEFYACLPRHSTRD